jgi:hypothetical protein
MPVLMLPVVETVGVLRTCWALQCQCMIMWFYHCMYLDQFKSRGLYWWTTSSRWVPNYGHRTSSIAWLLTYHLNVLATCMYVLHSWWRDMVLAENWSLASRHFFVMCEIVRYTGLGTGLGTRGSGHFCSNTAKYSNSNRNCRWPCTMANDVMSDSS